jgi:hypothetical protein
MQTSAVQPDGALNERYPDTPIQPVRRERRAAAASGINIFDGHITRDELAQMLGRDVRTIERWEQERRGPPAPRSAT